ncbi:MAG TPA: energy transducer TonB [Spongiibacteraceae bacterium]|nr:energy transducer TonB [Spongiibacteraceae bacterium]
MPDAATMPYAGDHAFQPRNDLLGFTLLLAAALHAALILGVTFSREQREKTASKLEITLAQYKSAQAPQRADYLAQHNQEGSGTLAEKALLTTRKTADFQDNVIRDISPVQQIAAQRQTSAQQALIATLAHAEQKTTSKNDRTTPQQLAESDVTIQQRSLEIASLEAKLDIQRQAYAARPRIRRLTSVAAKRSEDAEYLNQWRERIENVGNRNYPERAREQQIYGDLRLMVALLPNGEVHEVKVLKSSGQRLLDEAAIRIVHLAAPYDAFPPEIRQHVDVLEIIRTWRFHKDRLTSTN